MMRCHVYFRKGSFFFPTVARTDAGYFLEVEPVHVLSLAQINSIQDALSDLLARGNPIVTAPSRSAFPKPVILPYANVKSWSAFEKGARMWKLLESDGTIEIREQRRVSDGGWQDDTSNSLIAGSGQDGVESAAKVLANAVLAGT